MRAGLLSSAALHVGIIGAMVVSFSSPSAFDSPPTEAMPIDIVSDAEMSQMMAGKKDAPKTEAPKPIVEKVEDTPKPAEQLDAKITDKPEITAAKEAAAPPPPPTENTPPVPKPPAAQAEATPKPPPPTDAESVAAKPPEPKPEPPKPEQTAQATPAPTPPRKPKNIPPKVVQQQNDQREFKPDDIAALLDKRTPQRQAAIGDTINNTSSLGARVGTAATLSQTEIDALRARLMQLWNPPAGAANPQELIVTVRIRLNVDGTLAGPPVVVSSGSSPFFMTARDSAIRAIFRGQPFNMLSPAKYESWKEIEVTFDPRDMFRG